MHVLVFNSGSSSLKFGLYRVGASGQAGGDPSVEVLIDGDADAIGDLGGHLHASSEARHAQWFETGSFGTRDDAVARIVDQLTESELPMPDAIGHRIVHGGPRLRTHCHIDPAVMRELEAAQPFAPLHLLPALEIVRFAEEHFADRPQIACFDTAFHVDLDPRARTLPLPASLRADGVERYGFHGLSLESIVARLGGERPARVVIAHLGGGASVTAVRDGRSIDTTMGLTPTGGTMMGTRSGDLDPGVLLYLLREKRFDAATLEDMLERESGLAGVSGGIGDLRALHRAARGNDGARLAIAMFCRGVAKAIAAMIVALDGVDLLVFTGGIGEHDAAVRACICDDLRWIGVRVDDARNRAVRAGADDGSIEDVSSRAAVRVLRSDEDGRIAQHAYRLVGGAAPAG